MTVRDAAFRTIFMLLRETCNLFINQFTRNYKKNTNAINM